MSAYHECLTELIGREDLSIEGRFCALKFFSAIFGRFPEGIASEISQVVGFFCV
jgi:hypothetical protein